MNKRKGISLIVLVITILVMIILAGVVVVSLQKNNPIEKAKEATFKQSLAQIGEELEMFCVNEKAQNSEFIKDTLHASKNSLAFNTKTESSGKNIYDIIPSLKDSKYKNQVEVIQGMLFYRTPDKKEIPWLKELGIHYTGIVTGTVIIEGDTLVGVSPDYVNTGTLVIPNTVKKINPGAFSGCKDLNAVVLPEGITEIPDNCFRECVNLTSIQIPNTVTRIGVSAFRSCVKLNNVVLPANLTTIENEGFYWCKELSNITFNNKLKTIGMKAFSYTILDKIELKEGVIEIGQQAFEEVLAKTVILPESVEKIKTYAFYRARCEVIRIGAKARIEDGAFRRMPFIKEFTVSNANPYHTAVNNALYNKDMSMLIFAPSNVVSFTVPSSVKVIANSAFRQARDLQTVVIPEGVTTIGENVFEECNKLTALHIPSTVTSIGIRLLEGCSTFTTESLTVAANNPNFKAYNGALMTKDGKKIISVADASTSFTVPNTVTHIANSAFAKCWKMKNIVIPNNVVDMETDALRETGLVTVTIPGSIKEVKWGMFRGSINLTEVTFSEGTTFLKGSLFENCTKMTKVNIPSTISYIAGDFLSATKMLTEINISPANKTFKAVDNMILDKAGKALYAVSDAKKIITVPNGVTTIVGYSFHNTEQIQEVRLPLGVTTIQDNAFLYAKGLKKVTIPSSIISIGANTFVNTSNLSEIIIDKPEGSVTGAPWGATQGMKAVIWQ